MIIPMDQIDNPVLNSPTGPVPGYCVFTVSQLQKTWGNHIRFFFISQRNHILLALIRSALNTYIQAPLMSTHNFTGVLLMSTRNIWFCGEIKTINAFWLKQFPYLELHYENTPIQIY